jgi:hypothetical protein
MRTAEALNFCGAPVSESPTDGDLVLEVTPLTATAGSASIPIEVTLRNAGTERVVGTTGTAPAITFSADGVTLWHTSGIHDSAGVLVDLEPGESMTYPATFEPVVCGPEDETGAPEGLPADLPAAPAGEYRLSAALDFMPNDGTAGPVVVTGPAADAELR